MFKSYVRYGGTNLIKALKINDAPHFSNFCRMNTSDFKLLFKLIVPKITKSDSHFRKSITANKRLFVSYFLIFSDW